MATQDFAYYGTVIEATHRPEDLIPAFTAVLADLNPERAKYIQWDNPLDYGRIAEGKALIVTDRDIQCVPELIETLFNALDECAPDGYYFGAHPGDGSDFGFWEMEDGPADPYTIDADSDAYRYGTY